MLVYRETARKKGALCNLCGWHFHGGSCSSSDGTYIYEPNYAPEYEPEDSYE